MSWTCWSLRILWFGDTKSTDIGSLFSRLPRPTIAPTTVPTIVPTLSHECFRFLPGICDLCAQKVPRGPMFLRKRKKENNNEGQQQRKEQKRKETTERYERHKKKIKETEWKTRTWYTKEALTNLCALTGSPFFPPRIAWSCPRLPFLDSNFTTDMHFWKQLPIPNSTWSNVDPPFPNQISGCAFRISYLKLCTFTVRPQSLGFQTFPNPNSEWWASGFVVTQPHTGESKTTHIYQTDHEHGTPKLIWSYLILLQLD